MKSTQQHFAYTMNVVMRSQIYGNLGFSLFFSLSDKTSFLGLLQSLVIKVNTCPTALIFDRWLSSGAAEMHVKLQGDTRWFQHSITKLWDLVRSEGKMYYRLVNKNPGG